MTEFSSQRLFFRPLREEDVTDRYPMWLNDPEVNRFLETRFVTQTVASCMEFIADMNRDPNSHLLGIFEKKTDCHIGNIKIGFIKPAHLSAQLSLVIGEKSCWGRGFATEAIQKVTRWAFADLGLVRLEAGCYDQNIGSLRAFLKVGFTVEGYFRKSVAIDGRRIGSFWMGILKSEFCS